MLDALLAFLVVDQFKKDIEFDRQKSLLVDQRTGLDVAAAQRRRRASGDKAIVFGKPAALIHVGEQRFASRDSGTPGNLDAARCKPGIVTGCAR